MSDKEQQRITIPHHIMSAIGAVSANVSVEPVLRLHSVLMLIYGYAWYERQESVDPTGLAIPDTQWGEISDALALADNKVGDTNMRLTFINIGPSGYKEGE